MTTKIVILSSYFMAVLLIGLWARTRWRSTPETYFLADRKLGSLVLLGTMVATNFSAFTVFGASGAGYRDGYAFFPIMGFGTGFMALTFWFLGARIREVGQQHGVVTPPELVRVLYQHKGVSAIFALIMIIFTIPYLALQPMAAGYALEELLGLPYKYGCVLVTAIIMIYTLRGGMRAVAWTDVFQGVVMLVLLLAALLLTVRHYGGFVAANAQVLATHPELFSRPGGLGTYTLGIWFSYMLLWFFCDPMFPQLFQRFFAARSRRALNHIMLLYPLVCTVVFILPVAIGVLGRNAFPDLAGRAADRILPMLLTLIAGDVMAALVVAAGIAALMSTMDSQLLTLSSIFTRDMLPLVVQSAPESSLAGRLFVIGLSLAGLALAYNPPATILQIATQTFTGLAVLFPTVLFGLYLRRVYPAAAISSMLAGEAMLLGYYLEWWRSQLFLPVIGVMLVTFGVYLLVHVFCARQADTSGWRWPRWLSSPYLYLYLAIFILSMDFWAWQRVGLLLWGMPLWLLWFVGLSLLQTLIMLFMVRGDTPDYDA